MRTGLDRSTLAGLGLSTGGFLVSTYLTVAHYAHAPLACVNSGPVDCDAVTTSGFSVVLGTSFPVSLLGVLWFALNSNLFVMASTRAVPAVLLGHLAFAASGVLVALYLVYAELAVIHRICEWCTILHVLILGIFLIALRRAQTTL
jgi:uncharacterized membrane protein